MKNRLFGLILTSLVMVGCVGIRTTPNGVYAETGYATAADLQRITAVHAAAAATKQLGASPNGGFSSVTIGPDGSVSTQTSVMPSWAGGGGFVAPYAFAGQGRQGQAFADAIESAPRVNGNAPAIQTNSALAGTVDALGKRVEGLEVVVGEIKGDVRTIAVMHQPEPEPPKK